ncbi:MAG: ABC transporter ATP-binding protein [Clostridiales bacterium]|nr:ABC transporter ATP-binding protein [Clostridiales bacterium]
MFILECSNITKNYGACKALDSVNLQLEKGKIVGLLGPNGSGKTTLLKLANGLLSPTSGSISIAGGSPGVHSKKIVAYLPERTYLNEWMKVKDIVAFFADFYANFSREKAIDMLQALGLPQNAKLSSLSKGNKEKVQLILVMAREAELYLLDEPIGGVDPAARDYIINTIIRNYSASATILLSTHLIQDVERIFDSVVFLNKGKIALQGPVDDIREEKGCSIDELFREVFKC